MHGVTVGLPFNGLGHALALRAEDHGPGQIPQGINAIGVVGMVMRD